MKRSRESRGQGAFTLVETMVMSSVALVFMGLVFLVLNSGMNLYAKNTAVNAAHQQARSGVDQLLQNIHGSVSIPQLVDVNLSAMPAPGIGPAAGISFQLFENGPYPVVVNAAATDTSIVLKCGSTYVPAANTRLNIPNHKIEKDVVSSTYLGSGNRRFTFASPIGTSVTISGAGDDDDETVNYLINAYMTSRVSYAVIGSQMRYYPSNNLNTYKVIARNVTSALPFTIPTLSDGGLQNRYVAAVNISTVEPQFTNRGYAAVNMFISSLVPFRCRLVNSQ